MLCQFYLTTRTKQSENNDTFMLRHVYRWNKDNIIDFSFNTKACAPLTNRADQISSNQLNICYEASKARLNGVFQKGSQVKKMASLSEYSSRIDFVPGSLLSCYQPKHTRSRQCTPVVSDNIASMEFLIDISIGENHYSASVKHPFFINTCFGLAPLSIERIDTLITRVIWSASSERDTTVLEEGGGA